MQSRRCWCQQLVSAVAWTGAALPALFEGLQADQLLQQLCTTVAHWA